MIQELIEIAINIYGMSVGTEMELDVVSKIPMRFEKISHSLLMVTCNEL